MPCPSCDVVMQSSAPWPVYSEPSSFPGRQHRSPWITPIFDLWFLFFPDLNEWSSQGKSGGFISDLHSHFNLGESEGSRCRSAVGSGPASVASQSKLSASASSVCASPSTAHLPLSLHAGVTMLWEGLLWKIHPACAPGWRSHSILLTAVWDIWGSAGRATVPPSGKTKPDYF